MKIKSNLWFENEQKAFFGKGRIELLEQIDRYGSISKAAKAMKMSYKAAWDAVNEMNNLSAEPIVVRETGGKGGGGTRLTAKGHEYIRMYKEISTLQQKLFDLLGEQGDALENLLSFGRRLTLQTSARNQYHGTVTSMKSSAVTCEVELTLGGKETIYASITHKSAKAMGIDVGTDLFALIKSNWVLLATEPPTLSARNCLKGTIVSIQNDGLLSEVTLQLQGDNTITAVITSESLNELKFCEGDTAYAVFQSSHVLLAR
ncbi:TOBE domain-containing protein [Hydrogenimonas cancrithermarum]|uniref:ModE family transcriptional regulator n=1 Tax=Hydrogenimonas cancrithermarum TaxID=2993563 RepID=A0ABN6WVF0_9BACT|nr:TOBE domain-containing protein [Hydrogenimonas cancrithermarum]BDY12923.1 ModE family transcriptional regulator [Hydrogenimonas cancrithermarum]BDY13040.1 ModE family transcriptional regulator [Hydrogenimonas cancrithermarum]